MFSLPPDFDWLGHETPIKDLQALSELAAQAYETSDINSSGCALEVGSLAGLSALAILEEVTPLYCVDDWKGAVSRGISPAKAFAAFCKNMGHRLMREVIPCPGKSATWARVWPNHLKLDFVFIDGDHSFESCSQDIILWKQHIAKGGIIAVHDYQNQDFPGVAQAVQQFLPDFQTAGAFIAWKELT